MRYFQSIVILTALLCLSCSFFLLPPLEVVTAEFSAERVSVEFSAKPSQQSVFNAFTLTEDGGSVRGTFTFDGKTVYFAPENGIRQYREYELIITTSAEDEKGNSLQTVFKKGYSTKTDTERPAVRAITPFPESELDIEPAGITLLFSKPIDKTSFYAALQITPSFEYICEFNSLSVAVLIKPITPLKKGTRYTVSLSTELMDENRNRLLEKFTATFLYGLDKKPPEHTLEWRSKAGSTILQAAGISSGISTDAEFIIRFNERIKIDTIANYISITPDIGITVRPDKETEDTALFSFSSSPEWGTEYKLLIKKGIQDISENKTTEDVLYTIVFDDESCRPVSFIKAYLKNNTIFDSISKKDEYSSVLFDVVHFPTTGSNNEVATDLYLFFRVAENAVITELSVMDSLEISATNGCIEFSIRTVSVLRPADFLTSDIYATASADAELNDPESNIQVVQVGVEITNADKRGIITYSVDKTVRDSLGNQMIADFKCQVNKQ